MTETHPYISYLEGLREDRGALASLRRGLGRSPGTAPEMFRYVVPWLGAERALWREAAFYQVAALFALHPEPGGTGNMGDHFARSDPRSDTTAVERRFVALLAAHPDDLGFYLRQAISFLRSKEVPVNWHRLLSDLLAWSHPDGYVQKQWARSFWGRSSPSTAISEEE